jgi:hypothetical protein
MKMANIETLSDGSRRVTLWKRDGIDIDNYPQSDADTSAQRVKLVKMEKERDTALAKAQAAEVELQKRRMGWAGATKTERKPMAVQMTAQEIEEKEREWAQLGTELEDDLKRMRANPETPPAAIERHEKAIGALHRAYVGLRNPDDLTAIEAREAHEAASQSDGQRSALAKAEAIKKFDPSLSSAEAFRQAMRDPAVAAAYRREMGHAEPVALTGPAGLVKAEPSQPSQADVASVGEYADELMKEEGLSAGAAFKRAFAESGQQYGRPAET